jgi:hypothetical protein
MSYELLDHTEPRLPCPLTDDPTFKYVPAASTDITKTWRRFGWIPMAELKEKQNEKV